MQTYIVNGRGYVFIRADVVTNADAYEITLTAMVARFAPVPDQEALAMTMTREQAAELHAALGEYLESQPKRQNRRRPSCTC